MIRELRNYDPKPGCKFGGEAMQAVTPDLFIARRKEGWAIEINAATLPRLLVNRSYYVELSSGPQDKASKAWLIGHARQRQLAGQGARPAPAHDHQGRDRDREAAGSVLPPRRRAFAADDAAPGRRRDRDARIDRQPGDEQQISQLRARAVRAQIFLHQLDPVVRRRRRGVGRSGQIRDPRADHRRGSKAILSTTRWSTCSTPRASASRGAPSPNIARRWGSAVGPAAPAKGAGGRGMSLAALAGCSSPGAWRSASDLPPTSTLDLARSNAGILQRRDMRRYRGARGGLSRRAVVAATNRSSTLTAGRQQRARAGSSSRHSSRLVADEAYHRGKPGDRGHRTLDGSQLTRERGSAPRAARGAAKASVAARCPCDAVAAPD